MIRHDLLMFLLLGAATALHRFAPDWPWTLPLGVTMAMVAVWVVPLHWLTRRPPVPPTAKEARQ